MYRKIQDFLNDWNYESEGTAKIFSLITDANRRQEIHEGVRSLERLSWHLTQTITEMGHRAGLFPVDPFEGEDIPLNTASILEIYKDYSEQIAKAVNSKWTDSTLEDQVDMYGEQWSKGTILRVLINHQSHHRGQMTVILRMFDIPVPGLYGPSKEEWAQMGMLAPD